MRKTIVEAIAQGEHVLESKGLKRPRLEAELLMAFLTRKNRIEVYLEGDRPLAEREQSRYLDLLRRRTECASLEDITDAIRFHRLDLEINAAVFVPHKETELLVAKAIDLAKELAWPRVIDLGTGSGAIALALASEVSGAHVWATDISPAAVRLAQRNAARSGLSERVTVLAGDMFDPLPASLKGSIDLIVSNPPFRPVGEVKALAKEHSFEPSEAALGAGEDGLGYHRLIVGLAPQFLGAGGWVLIEVCPPAGRAGKAAHENALEVFGAGWSEKETLVGAEGNALAILAKWSGK